MPLFRVKSLPVRPTAIAVLPLTQVAPDRYSVGAPVRSDQLCPPSFVFAKLSGDVAGVAKSPPTASPCCWLRKASALIPAVGPLRIGVEATVQVRPRLRDVKTRASVDAPVPNHALRPWLLVMHWPLAAKAASPANAGGIPAGSTMFQVRPLSVVLRIRKCTPSGGSESVRPTFLLKKVMQSKNAFGSVFW